MAVGQAPVHPFDHPSTALFARFALHVPAPFSPSALLPPLPVWLSGSPGHAGHHGPLGLRQDHAARWACGPPAALCDPHRGCKAHAKAQEHDHSETPPLRCKPVEVCNRTDAPHAQFLPSSCRHPLPAHMNSGTLSHPSTSFPGAAQRPPQPPHVRPVGLRHAGGGSRVGTPVRTAGPRLWPRKSPVLCLVPIAPVEVLIGRKGE